MNVKPTEEETALFWHGRFAHIAHKRVHKLINGKMVLGLPDNLPPASFEANTW
ncbi:hypothetical protein CROQUDRAFT_95778 [Cronartium quercuum f. sp. fusiforme G11]|uniref:GAG-pre-integrase domain-containing protein n=1 Tax=Cronartium quercuum f. sp. fusiforme G11 TaxID=708437 RepID=A0A9P6NBX9_9BASI|nr:hypothetical protein CROQUDRAFT_95778 [Cronartium quercuum f. sp. fusiforme G11]